MALVDSDYNRLQCPSIEHVTFVSGEITDSYAIVVTSQSFQSNTNDCDVTNPAVWKLDTQVTDSGNGDSVYTSQLCKRTYANHPLGWSCPMPSTPDTEEILRFTISIKEGDLALSPVCSTSSSDPESRVFETVMMWTSAVMSVTSLSLSVASNVLRRP